MRNTLTTYCDNKLGKHQKKNTNYLLGNRHDKINL